MKIFKSLLTLFACSLVQVSFAQSCTNETKIVPTNAGQNWQTGNAVAMDQNRILVGSPAIANGNAGIAHLYEYDGTNWIETVITSSDAVSGDRFGESVDIDGDRLVIGASQETANGSDAGSIYVYDWDGVNWVETKISASDGSTDDYFGQSVSLSGDRIIVGAPFYGAAGNTTGAAYIFEYDGSNWIETKILASDGTDLDFFGFASHIDGDRAVVGAYRDNSAYLLEYDGSNWIETKFSSPTLGLIDYGFGVCIHEDRLLIGAPGDFVNGGGSGSMFLYNWDGTNWIETKLVASDGMINDSYGETVSIKGDYMVTGAQYSDPLGLFSGSAYLYAWDGTSWIEEKIIPSDGEGWDNFGSDVEVENGQVVVGSEKDEDGGITSGSIYIYDCCPITAVYYEDQDGDGFGNASSSQVACSQPNGYVIDQSDCDDTNPDIYPGAEEICDGIENNCDGMIDDNCAPCDGDNLVINSIDQDTSRASLTILSNTTINQSTPILFTAGNSIELVDDFEVVLGSVFEAIISTCVDDGP